MPRIHTLSDIGECKKLGDIPSNRYPPSRTELENQLACANRDREIAIECGNRLANKCSVLDKDNKRIQRDLKQSNNDKEKLSKHTYQLINEVKRLSSESDTLTSQINQLQISNTKYGAKDIIRLKKIKSLQSMNKILNSKLASAQKDAFSIQENLSKTESENLSLKSKIAEVKRELVSTVSDLERLKSEDISNPVLGGNDEKNMTESDSRSEDAIASDISAVLQSRPLGDELEIRDSVSSLNHDTYVSNEESEIRGYASPSKSLRRYFVSGKSMDQAEKNDTEISSKVSEGTNINEISEDIISRSQGSKSHDYLNRLGTQVPLFHNTACSAIELPRLKNVRPFLPADSPSPIESHSKIPVETIPMIALLLLALLIIVTIWITFIKPNGKHLKKIFFQNI
ncbi:5641_t:CDS:1 [Paraglomus brasilianum]|uniref:5641_t:CDS:1 n=1 Tax=Paraglomus brasilianum TaxID=144538 RepID=A0A9N9DZ23_9GLOM|nr:5641_t:CDS:1 [Paraglomus brasilianum]